MFPDGSRYEGQWKDGLKHGKARGNRILLLVIVVLVGGGGASGVGVGVCFKLLPVVYFVE